MSSSWMMNDHEKKALSLYIHYPFCVRKCRYCDFLSFPADAAARQAYLDRLGAEMAYRSQAFSGYEVTSLFIGGGTPSLMSGDQLLALMDHVRRHFSLREDAELTMECNPGTVDAEKLSAMRKAGINRISFGLQSARDEELRLLGRIHSFSDFLKSYEAAREAGFDNINVDLMSALPGQSLSSCMESLEAVLALAPEHLSVYSLIIEPGTPFWDLYGEDAPGKPAIPLPDEDTEREMYHRICRRLEAAGYDHYEVSNFARPGRACRHNLVYWRRGEYLGLGLGAASLVDERRFSNTRDLPIYMSSFAPAEEERLTEQARMEETMFLGLRCMRGVSEAEFEAAFGKRIGDIYGPVLEKLCAQGLLAREKGRFFLTERGLDVATTVMAAFLL